MRHLLKLLLFLLCPIFLHAKRVASFTDLKASLNRINKSLKNKQASASSTRNSVNPTKSSKNRQETVPKIAESQKCLCSFDYSRRDCACCKSSERHCSNPYFKDRCGDKLKLDDDVNCLSSSVNLPLSEFDVWTRSSKGCKCLWKDDLGNKDCACCYNGAIGCPNEKFKDKCVTNNHLHLCDVDSKDETTEISHKQIDPSDSDDIIQEAIELDEISTTKSTVTVVETQIESSQFASSKKSMSTASPKKTLEPSKSRTKLPLVPPTKKRIIFQRTKILRKAPELNNIMARSFNSKLESNPIIPKSKNTMKLTQLLNFAEESLENGKKQPFIEITADDDQNVSVENVVKNLENILENQEIKFDTPEVAISGRSAGNGWCEYDSEDSDQSNQKIVTIPFYSYPETYEDNYGKRHCVDANWLSLAKLGSKIRIIISADNGPGMRNSYHHKSFLPCIEKLASHGVKIIGYIDADLTNGRRDVLEIITDCLTWVDSYGVRNIGGVYLNQLPGWYDTSSSIEKRKLYDPEYLAKEIRSLGRKDWEVLVNPKVGVLSL